MAEKNITRFGLSANNLRQNSDTTNPFSEKLPINYYALHSLKQGVDSLNSMNTTRLGQSVTADPAITCDNPFFRVDASERQLCQRNSTSLKTTIHDRNSVIANTLESNTKHNIISDDDVRNFMRSSVAKLDYDPSSSEIFDDKTTTDITCELQFSPRHIARSTPNLSDLKFKSDTGDLLTPHLFEKQVDSKVKLTLQTGLVKSPGLAQRISPSLSTIEANDKMQTSEGEHEVNTSDLNGNCYVGMRLANFDSNISSGDSEACEKSHRANYSRPYVSAPMLPNVSDSQLTEISLDNNDDISQPLPPISLSINEHEFTSSECKLPLSQTAPVNELLSRHAVSPEFETAITKESSCELMNLSTASAQSVPRCTSKAMPSVTDGLSSGSEVDSPQNSPPMRAQRPIKSGIAQSDSHNCKPRYFTEFTGKQSSSRLSPQENPSLTMCHTMESPMEPQGQNATQFPASKSLHNLKTDLASPNEEHRHCHDNETQDNHTSSIWIRRNSEHGGSCNAVRHQLNHSLPANENSVPHGKAYLKLQHSEDTLSNGCSSNEPSCKRSPVPNDEPDLRSQSTNECLTHKDFDSDEDTDQLLQRQYESDKNVEIPELKHQRVLEEKKRRGREVAVRHPDHPSVLIEGVLFRSYYLGSTQLVSEGQPSKATRMMQAQEAVGRIKSSAPDGDSQPSVPVDLFVSTEKIMVLNTNLKEIMMDHSLRTISYIADIGDILVLMARRRIVPPNNPNSLEEVTMKRQTKIICHVFQSDEAQLIAQSIGHAFQLAYLEFLKANGIEDPQVFKDMDYQEVLNQQEIFAEELHLFADKDTQKEVIVPKQRNEPLGIVIVESGWGSMLPTVVLANMNPTGPAARCGQLNIGNQIMAVNGQSLVGLPLSNCQQYIKNCRTQSSVKLSIVSCPPVVEVLIKRPDVKYQLGFSVQNGVICSLLRGGIAERGGIRVGHRIIEINGQSVVAVPHEKIVNMLATGVGEIHLRTMPTSIFRLLTGQETPHYI